VSGNRHGVGSVRESRGGGLGSACLTEVDANSEFSPLTAYVFLPRSPFL
jgi:hypothetical protein